MKILSIEIDNTKKLQCFRLEANGNNVEVAGTTGGGKTTAISALWEIIEKHPDSLSHGAKKGEIKVKVGDSDKFIIASRKNTKTSSTITLKDQDGKNFSIKEFKEMLSSLSVNPHKIMDMKPKEQVSTLLKAANMEGFDLSQVELDISTAEAERLEAYRDMEKLKVGEEPEKVDKVSVKDLLDNLNEAMEVNKKNSNARDLLSNLDTEYENLGLTISGLQSQVDELLQSISAKEAESKELATRIQKGNAVIKKLVDTPIEPLEEKITSIEDINNKATTYSNWLEQKTKWDTEKERHTKASDTVKELQESKQSALDNAKWPLKGLTIEDGDVLYNDCLLSNLGESEQMLVCAALAVEDIKSHPLKVVRMDGVESMSKKDFTQLQKLFNDSGIQVLSTRVSRDKVEDNEIEIVEGVYEGSK